MSAHDKEDGEKVHIPNTLEESDSDSDSFAQKLQKLNESEKPFPDGEDKGESSKQIWFMKESNELNVQYDIPLSTKTRVLEENPLVKSTNLMVKRCYSSPLYPLKFISQMTTL